MFALIIKHARAEDLDHRVVRLDLSSLVEFLEGFVEFARVNEYAGPVIRRDRTGRRVETRKFFKCLERFLVFAVETVHYAFYKIQSRVVRELFLQQFDLGAGLLSSRRGPCRS